MQRAQRCSGVGQPQSRIGRRILAGSLMAGAMALGASSVASAFTFAEPNVFRWDCPGTPRAACWASQTHTYSDVVAINNVDPYQKCARLDGANSGMNYIRDCRTGNEVYVLTWGTLAPYPNTTNSLNAAVGNDTDQTRGLRGAGSY